MQKNSIFLSDEEYKKITSSRTVGTGYFAKVYKYDEDNVIKIARDYCLDVNHNVVYDNNHPWIKLPKTNVVYCGQKVGYITSFFPGKKLYDIKDVDLEKFLIALKKLYQEIKWISQRQLLISDMSDFNLMYDENTNTMACIDTDLWTYWWNTGCEYYHDPQILCGTNMDAINGAIVKTFDLRTIINYDSLVDDYKDDLSNYLANYKERLEKEVGQISTIKQLVR